MAAGKAQGEDKPSRLSSRAQGAEMNFRGWRRAWSDPTFAFNTVRAERAFMLRTPEQLLCPR